MHNIMFGANGGDPGRRRWRRGNEICASLILPGGYETDAKIHNKDTI